MKKGSVYSSETLKTTYRSTKSILQNPTVLIPSFFIVSLSSIFQSCENFEPHTLSGNKHVCVCKNTNKIGYGRMTKENERK